MLESLLDRVRESRKEFDVYAGPDADADVASLFGSHNVHVEYRSLPSGRVDPFLVVEDDGEFAGAIALEDLDGLLEPPVRPPGDDSTVSEGYRVLFDLLEDTVFAAMDRRELLAVSHEIEDRAARAGAGTLRVCFQRLSAFAAQVERYRWLVETTDLDGYVYGVRDWEPPAVPGVQYGSGSADALERYWVLAFEGERPDAQTTALVAVQDGATYEGFWTDDPELTREVATRLAYS